MARPWSRKRRDDTPEPTPVRDEPAEDVHLDHEDHAWWAQTDLERVWRPKVRKAADPKEKRDILSEHFGDDWRNSFGVTPSTEDEPTTQAARDQQASDDQDPYKVLQVEPTATWAEIVAAHRHQARVHHPDRLFGQSEEEKEEGEDRIRVINAAYKELRIRRGR